MNFAATAFALLVGPVARLGLAVDAADPYAVLHPADLPPANLAAARPAPLKGFLSSPEWHGGYVDPTPPAVDPPEDTMEFYYLGLSEVMDGMDSFPGFDTVLEPRIAASAGRGKHAVIRFYMDYPQADWDSYVSHTPAFLKVEPYNVAMTDWTIGTNTVGQSPDYSDPNLVQALKNFIAALGERYDGDPRVGFVQAGLLGFWGEWHTFTGDSATNDWIPDQTKVDVIDAFDNAFQTTQMQLRYPHWYAVGRERFGLHDDSFAHSTVDEGVYGSPMNWFFWPKVVNGGMADFWKKGSMGGELRPELQSTIFDADYPAGTEFKQDYGLCSETTHATFMVNYKAYSPGYTGSALEKAKAANDRMGYAYRISEVAASTESVAGTVDIVATITQDGIAEFYYDLGLALTCEGYAATLPGVEAIVEEGSSKSFTFAGVPDDEACLSAIDFSLTSSYALEGSPVKFAQGDVDGITVRVAIPTAGPTTPAPSAPPVTSGPSMSPTSRPTHAPTLSPTSAPSLPVYGTCANTGGACLDDSECGCEFVRGRNLRRNEGRGERVLKRGGRWQQPAGTSAPTPAPACQCVFLSPPTTPPSCGDRNQVCCAGNSCNGSLTCKGNGMCK